MSEDQSPSDSCPGNEERAFKPWPEQDENGVDLSLIRANLRLTPLERVRKMEAFMRDMRRMREKLPEQSQRIFKRLRAERG